MKIEKQQKITTLKFLTKMLDKIRRTWRPNASKLLNSKLFIYEVKTSHNKVYYKHNIITNEP